MPFDLSRHPHFGAWADPQTGVVSHVLTERVAPVQQTFYYTNPSVSADERWLWFTCAFPPNPQRVLGVVSLDPDRPLICCFPQAAFTIASPMVAPEGDACLFCLDARVLRIDVEGRIDEICALPNDYIAGRHLWRLATHLSLSADGRSLALDGHIGDEWFLAIADRASGKVDIVEEFGACHDHAQFSPTHPDLVLIARDQQRNPVSGRFLHHHLRVHLIDLQRRTYDCLTPHITCRPFRGACHEWWTTDGTVAYIEYDSGVWEIDLATGRHDHVWKEPLCHAHSDPTVRFFCADQSPYAWPDKPCAVLFFDRESDRRIAIDHAMPPPPIGRKLYHLDPHPQFSPQGTWVAYTTMRHGRVDVALAPVSGIRERMG